MTRDGGRQAAIGNSRTDFRSARGGHLVEGTTHSVCYYLGGTPGSIVMIHAICLLSAMLLPAAPGPKEKPFYPTVIGTRWVYRYETGKRKDEATFVVTAVERKADRILVSVEGQGKDAPYAKFVFSLPEKGLIATRIDQSTIVPFGIIKLPPKAGDEWGVDLTPASPDSQFRGTAKNCGLEKVTVPSGTYEAWKVVITWLDLDDVKTPPWESWYVPGVGVIKNSFGDNTDVLKSFTPGK